jgi:hypothetical protein
VPRSVRPASHPRLRLWASVPCLVAAVGISVFSAPSTSAQGAALPNRLTNAEFWQLSRTYEEPGGKYHSDNFTSNEPGMAETASLLSERLNGGVYIGVGPEQNFSYIVAIKPDLAFIVDIRRQAVIQHLMFKALFELSATRAEFISRLFSRRRPPGPAGAPIQRIWEALPPKAESDGDLYSRNRSDIENLLVKVRGIPLTADELTSLDYVYRAFYTLGPAINYAGYQPKLTTGNVDFEKLSVAADKTGVLRSFLGSEENFKFIKAMHERNLIVPVEADIAGPRAVRGIGDYVRARGARITAFYISNIEQYLFGRSAAPETDINGGFKGFYDNLATLPVDTTSLVVRGYARSSATCVVNDLLKAVAAGRVKTFSQAQKCGN